MLANATLLSLSLTTASSSLLKHEPFLIRVPAKRSVSYSAAPYHRSSCVVAGRSSNAKRRVGTAFPAFVDEVTAISEKQGSPTEVYLCNLPRSCDLEQLLHMFKPHGTVLSAEICRHAETGESKGSAYVTMGSIKSAKNALAALDGLVVGWREMRVRFSVQINSGRRSSEAMNSPPKRTIFYEGPHKVYVGNLARYSTPEDVRHLFGRFGNVASVRLLQDLKQGKSRVYAFVSYLSQRERDAAMSLNGAEFCGRPLVVREGVEKTGT